jgi:outer membrane protein|tara:strand:+ start:402 stop:908 length:507 start_codon:yes stop_codon:yes gene_type:complete
MFNVKTIKIIILSFILIFMATQSKSETKVAFIQMDILINESSAGKSLIEELNKIDKKNKKRFKETKEKLDKEKNDITLKKDILSKEEYEKQIIKLNDKFRSFQAEAQKSAESLKAKRNAGMQKILKEINILLSEYSKKNELTFIIDQKNIIIGKSDLNITKEILKSLK